MITFNKHKKVKEKRSLKKSGFRKLFFFSFWLNIIFILFLVIGAGIGIRKELKGNDFNASVTKAFGKFKRQVLGMLLRVEYLFHKDDINIGLDIKFKDYKKLMRKREEALRIGILNIEDNDFVSAELNFKNKKIPIKLRLKGDTTDHLLSEKWSFRIHINGDNSFLGMKRFSIQDPATRVYAYEWGFLNNLRLEDILAPRYEFINVTINGKDKGVYALEESFSKELLESQGRREGVIVKFDEGSAWRQRANWFFNENKDIDFTESVPYCPDFFILQPRHWLNSEFDTFRTSKVNENIILSNQRDSAFGLLEAFRRGELKPSEVFDVKLITKFLALTHLWGGEHGLGFENIRFYFNPVTYKLEPIGFDAMCGNIWETPLRKIVGAKGEGPFPWGYNDWVQIVLSDTEIARQYIKECLRVSSDKYITFLKHSIEGQLKRQLRILWRYKPETIDWTRIIHNQEFIKRVLNPVEQIVAYFESNDYKEIDNDYILKINIENLLTLPVKIESVSKDNLALEIIHNDNKGRFINNDNEIILSVNDPLCIQRNFKTIFVKLPKEYVLSETKISDLKFTIHSKVIGSNFEHSTEVYPFAKPTLIKGFPDRPSVEQFLNDFNFCDFIKKENKIYIPKGEYLINKDFVLPRKASLVLSPGTIMKFKEGAILFSDGPIKVKGLIDMPIKLCPQDKSWGGVVVMNADKPSFFEHARIEGISGVKRNGWVLTGGLNFYKSPIFLSYSIIENFYCEDMINFINTIFSVSNCFFSLSYSDAIDSDFSNGKIFNTNFSDIGADAIDASGSDLKICKVNFNKIKDKCISAGEKSTIKAEDLFFTDSRFGVVSKDLSFVEIFDSDLINLEYGLAAFMKKPAYGPGKLIGERITLKNLKVNFLLQEGSYMEVDGKVPDSINVDIDQLYRISENNNG